MASLEMDWMEYANDAAAQLAYVSSDSIGSATGGTITKDGAYTVHTFLLGQTGQAFTPLKAGNVSILVVAGGGGSGTGYGGGGGGGGIIYNASFAVTAQAYTVTVGGGGITNGSNNNGSNGDNSVFSDQTALGGGGGGAVGNSGNAGGCGGGGGGDGGGTRLGGAGSAQGYKGGDGNPTAAGGGGGTGALGGNAGVNENKGGAGGAGFASTIYDGSTKYYAGGGSGNGTGGADAPNTGGTAVSTAGADDTGAGGGGDFGAGGSGIVIIRYLSSLQSSSEATIKTQGTNSLKGIAAITDSLNKTLTRTATLGDLSGVKNISFDIRSNRTGSNIKIGLVDAGATTEITPNIITADTFQKVNWDISNVADANKNAITAIRITIVNADQANTFYLDNFKIEQAIDVFGIT